MYSLRKLALLFPVLCLLASCSTDFEVNAPYRPITIVYGMLNMADTAQYIRIQKAFLDEKASATVLSKIEDSNYYKESILSVHLKELNNGVVINDYVLPRVNLNNENRPKDSGAFSNENSYAYKYKGVLNYTSTYRLVISNSETGEVDSAETPVILNQRSPQPQGFSSLQFNDQTRIAFSEPGKATFALQSNIPTNAGITEAVIRMHWVDKVGSVQTAHSADFHIQPILAKSSNNIAVYDPLQLDIQTFLKNAVGPAPANTERYLDSSDIFIWAGGAEYAKYITINNATGGLTADQIRQAYTNVKGKNVLGLFSTRTYIVRNNIGPTSASLDSLMHKASLSSLNFKGVTDH